MKNVPIHIVFFLLVFINKEGHSQSGLTGKTQFKLGISTRFKEPGMTLQLGRVLGESRFKLSANYHRRWSKALIEIYSNGQLITSYTDVLIFNMYSVTGEYLLFPSKDIRYKGLAIGMGPGYAYSTDNDLRYLNGPGFALKSEYQGVLKNNWYYGMEFFFMYFSNQNDSYRSDKKVLFLMPLNLTVGFWY